MRLIHFVAASILLLLGRPLSVSTESTLQESPLNYTLTARHFGSDGVLLSWDAPRDKKVVGFEIQRATANTDFQTIGFVPAPNSALASPKCQFVDQPNSTGQIGYRVLAAEASGNTKMAGGLDFQFAPQSLISHVQSAVSKKGVSIAFTAADATQLTIALRTAAGDLVRAFPPQTYLAGKHTLVWDRTNEKGKSVPPGSYVAELQAGDSRTNIDLLLE